MIGPDTPEPPMPAEDPQPDPTRTAATDRATLSAAGVTGSLADPATAAGGPADGPASATPATPAARYALGAEIARGGMGAVYRATDTAFGREVAVKVLLDKYAPDSFTARRFADEARITGQLQHPNIPAVHDLGTLPDGRPFLAMKLIQGDTLDALLKARPDPADDRGRFVAAFEQVCQAVAYAHAHRVIHRDLKPGNVMVGSYGEVQVMDWGLAKVLTAGGRPAADPTDPEGAVAPDPMAVKSLRDAELLTQYGSVLGTPAYMAPEQAVGAVDQIDERSDVFGLGGILAAVLTGRPPFVGATSESTRQMAALGQVEGCFERLAGCGAEPDLVALCRRCLSPRKDGRPADAGEVAGAVAALRAAAGERARRAELDRVKAEGDTVAAELRVEGERQKAEEQRKRRRVQLVLAGVVLVVAVGGGIAAVQVQSQRDVDRFAAEQKRQDDLRVADEGAQRKAREVKAAALVQALATAEPGAVPVLLKQIAEHPPETRPHIRQLASLPIEQRAGLYGRLALQADTATSEPERAQATEQLSEYFFKCRGDELTLLLGFLSERISENNVRALWSLAADFPMESGAETRHVRRACLLARLTPHSDRWATYASDLVPQLVRMNPLQVGPFAEALEPVRHRLLGPLLKGYPQSRAKIEFGKLAVADLAAEATAFDLTANLLARYTTDRPAELAELALTVDTRHYPLFKNAIEKNRGAVAPLLKAELAKPAAPRWAVDGVGIPLSGLTGSAALGTWIDPDAALAERGKRQGHAAAALLALGEGEAVWPVFRFPADGDPTARSYLLERLAAVGALPLDLMRRFDAEADVSAKRALLVALGGFPPDQVPAREAFAGRLLKLYREHPDPGLHSATDWLLRQKWGKAKDVEAIDAELAKAAGPKPPAGKDWFFNGQGQTFAVVRGPVEFTMGSPPTEPGRAEEEPHRKRIGRTFAIATKEVTVEQFLRFRPDHSWLKRHSPGPDTPAVAVRWYDAAEYCNWLSEREGIPKEQWCYEPLRAGAYSDGVRIRPGHLTMTGYRLPTEAEWEFACRAGTGTSRYHGRGEELLPSHGWFGTNAGERAWPVGALRPNEWGLFDMLGNAMEWCEDAGVRYRTGRTDDTDDSLFRVIDERMSRVVRGGTYFYLPADLRSANRDFYRPGELSNSIGFRPVRTMP
jgi:formylglycine-generating enzyme required for sulfatase activity